MEEKKEVKTINFFDNPKPKNKKNIFLVLLILIIIVGTLLRFHYFTLTSEQPVWWDEADYMAYAKNLANLGSNWTITPQHNSLFPFLAAFLFILGFPGSAIKFVLELLPSILLIPLVYFLTYEIYKNKPLALITSFLMAFFWPILFNTTRFHLGIPALLFAFLGLYVFWRGYENKNKFFKLSPKYALPITSILILISYSIRRSYILFGIFLFFYLIFTKDVKKLVKNKQIWITVGITIIFFFIIENTIFITTFQNVAETYYHPEQAFNFEHLNVFSSFFTTNFSSFHTWLYLFYFGFILVLTNLFLNYGRIRHKRLTKADLFSALTIILTLSYFIFYQRGVGFGEPRWYFPMLFATFTIVGRGSIFIYDYLRKYEKNIAVAVVLFLLLFGAFYQYKQADFIINNKKDSFQGLKQASLYLEEYSFPEEKIISTAVPQVTYYSERDVFKPISITNWTGSDEELPFDLFLSGLDEDEDIKYIIVSFSQPGNPNWMLQYQGNLVKMPFMESYVDFTTQAQKIEKNKTYGGITIELLKVFQDTLVYEIRRE